MSITCLMENLSIGELLRADPFAEETFIKSNNAKSESIISRENFFSKVYADVEGNLCLANGAGKDRRELNVDYWLNQELSQIDNSVVVFFEGYAGCGKSIFVQYLLKTQLKTLSYDYNYYNYDIGAYFDKKNVNQIRNAIDNCFLDRLADIVLNGKMDTISKLKELTEHNTIEYLDSSNKIAYNFTFSNALVDAIECLQENKNKMEFRKVMQAQIEQFNTEQILALDLLLRLAIYITDDNRLGKVLYVCYDNLDAIENIDELNAFEKQLITLRKHIDEFINKSLTIFQGMDIPRFALIATFRKITAARLDISSNPERSDDYPEYNRFIYHIETSHLYNYRTIIQNRTDYFEQYFKNKNINGDDLINKMKSSLAIFDSEFVQKRFAGLWNNNYRTCSDVMKMIFAKYEAGVKICIELCKKKEDGYDLNCFAAYGASAIFMNLICKVFDDGDMWGQDHLNLISLGNECKDDLSKMTSFSRLLLTYINNKCADEMAVSVKDIFKDFGKLYSSDEICDSLAKMLKRDKTGTWRRPIYYQRNAFMHNLEIEKFLKEQWKEFKNNNKDYPYTELTICESGKTIVNRIVTDFEFYSLRVNNEKSLYLEDDAVKIKQMIENVYKAVKCCCINTLNFCSLYMKQSNITDVKYFMNLPIHPRTLHGKPQLHIERAIFSHIAYLNYCGDFFEKSIKRPENRKKVEDIFLEYKKNYLDLYIKYIKPFDSSRSAVADKLLKELN